jgi:hypothetical protein
VSQDCAPELVYGMREEFQEYNFTNFKANLKTLHNTINTNQAKAENDKAALLHDLLVRPPKNPAVKKWNESAAQKLLKEDIEEEKHHDMTTRQLWESREEYQEWPAKKFIKHVHSWTNSCKQSTYWVNKTKKKTSLVKTITEILKKPDEDGNDETDEYNNDTI